LNASAIEIEPAASSTTEGGELRWYLGDHYELTEPEVFEMIYGHARSKHAVTRVRIPHTDGATMPKQICQIPAYIAEFPKTKHFATPGIQRRVRNSKGVFKYSQKEKGVGKIFWRVVDLDCPGTVATEEIAEMIARLMPGAMICWANGLQIFIRPSGRWSRDSLMLAILGEFLAAQTGLTYDAHHFNFKDGAPYDHEGHAYRIPGYASRAERRVRFFAPEVEEKLDACIKRLGLKIPIIVRRPAAAKKRTATAPARAVLPAVPSDITPNAVPRPIKISMGEKYAEFGQAMKLMHSLRRQGVSFEDSCEQVATHGWTHCKEKELRKSFKKYFEFWAVTAGDGEFVSNDADQVIYYSFLTDSVTNKQKAQQRTWALYAHRAWSLNILYDMGFNQQECVRAFVCWDQFRKIRRLSLAAVSRKYLRKDLKRSFDKFSSGLAVRPARPELVENVRELILAAFSSAKKFKTYELDLLKHKAGVTSTRHLKRILGMLVTDGYLVRSGIYAKSAWRFTDKLNELINPINEVNANSICMAHVATSSSSTSTTQSRIPATTPSLLNDKDTLSTKSQNISKIEVVNSEISQTIPPVAAVIPNVPTSPWVADKNNPSLPPREVYTGEITWQLESEIKNIFRLLQLKDLKARWKIAVKICCDAPFCCPEQWERDWLAEIIIEKESEIKAAKQRTKDKRKKQRKAFYAESRFLQGVKEGCIIKGEEFTDKDWTDVRGFMRLDLSRLINPEAQKRETDRRENLMEYFQIRINSGRIPPLAVGETLLDRVLQFDAEQKVIRDKAAAARKPGTIS